MIKSVVVWIDEFVGVGVAGATEALLDLLMTRDVVTVVAAFAIVAALRGFAVALVAPVASVTSYVVTASVEACNLVVPDGETVTPGLQTKPESNPY